MSNIALFRCRSRSATPKAIRPGAKSTRVIAGSLPAIQRESHGRKRVARSSWVVSEESGEDYAFQFNQICRDGRSEEHTSELQSLMRISYAVFCLKKKTTTKKNNTNIK